MHKAVGSYFELETQSRNKYIYHPNCIYLNTGRNAFEYILKVLNVNRLHLPLLSCEALLTPLKKLKIDYEYYPIDHNQFPLFDFSKISDSDYFLYINYFGLKNNVVEILAAEVKNLIIDNTQAFFSAPFPKTPTFYSTRKFFGVSDGALLLNLDDHLKLELDKSADRMRHLLLRAENEPEVGYPEYQKVEEELDYVPLRLMSTLTNKILHSIDFKRHKDIRNNNFSFLSDRFHSVNKYKFISFDGPFAYPLWVKNGNQIKKKLINERVFIPTYWPNVLSYIKQNSKEYDMVNNIISIPVDSRYTKDSLNEVANLINKYL